MLCAMYIECYKGDIIEQRNIEYWLERRKWQFRKYRFNNDDRQLGEPRRQYGKAANKVRPAVILIRRTYHTDAFNAQF